MDAHAEGHSRIYQAQTQVFNDYGGSRARATGAVVVPVVAPEAAAESMFTGRERQVARLVDLLDPSGDGAGVPSVMAVAGLAGVGKTALARRAAGVAVERGWFTGGAVFTNLHGYDPEAKIEPGQVFAPLLRALGVPADQVPPVPGEQATVYHRVLVSLAEQHRPVLLVLDNVSGSEQVRDLLPTHRAHRVLVTSRHTLGDLGGVRTLDLTVLAESEAVALLDAALRARDPEDRRIAEDPAGAAELAGLGGFLPLALRITASLLADDPTLRLADLVAELADTADRLGVLSYGDRGVRAAFDLSWRHLCGRDAQAARLFRLLSVNPGPEVSIEAVAALADRPVQRVRRYLRVLRQAHLIEAGTAPGRWWMHDLVGLFAARLADVASEEFPAAAERLVRHYLVTADAADDHLRALPGHQVPDRFTGRDDALAWMDAERPNLVATVGFATEAGHPDMALQLSLVLVVYLGWRRHYEDAVSVATGALRAAEHLADRGDEGRAWNNFGVALSQVRRFDEAVDAHERAVAIARQFGDRGDEAVALNNLGAALQEVRRFDEALAAHEQAVTIRRELGDRHGEGRTLSNIGAVLRQLRRFEEAIAMYDDAITMFQEAGDRHAVGKALDNQGLVLREVRRFDEAVAAHEQAVATYRELGDRDGEAGALTNFGVVLRDLSRFDEAIAAQEQAVSVYREVEDRHGEGVALNNLGAALHEVRRFDEAVAAFARDLAVCQELGDRHGEGVTLNNLGLVLHTMGRYDEATSSHQRAVAILTEVGDRHGEALALRHLGLDLRVARRFDDARRCWQQSVTAFTDVGAEDDAEEIRGLLDELP